VEVDPRMVIELQRRVQGKPYQNNLQVRGYARLFWPNFLLSPIVLPSISYDGVTSK
jgi:hypothetical protein